MQYKTAELEGALLDAAVAKAERRDYTLEGYGKLSHLSPACWTDDNEPDEDLRTVRWYAPSSSWEDGGPIIERERISLEFDRDMWWAIHPEAPPIEGAEGWRVPGPTALVAAMRAKVASKFGDHIELP